MAKGTYISKNLTVDQQKVLKALYEHEVEIFTLSELQSLSEVPAGTRVEIIENLADKNFLSRIERGKYCLPTFRDEYVIGNYLLPEGAIAYWSALHRHGLTERFPNAIFIQSPKLKRNKEVFGVRYQFIKVKPEKFTGITTEGFRGRTFRITDKEKTIMDCFDLQQYAGDYADLIRAFVQGVWDTEKLVRYGKAVNNLAAMKRMAYLAELTQKDDLQEFTGFVLSQMNRRYTPFDPAGPEKGETVKKWKLQLNISNDELVEMIETTY
jgi:predicted transcriptional regulator of viral defense system